MKCPYCGTRRAKVQPEKIRPNGATIHAAIDCANPKCTAYNPVKSGYHADMLPEKHTYYRKYLDAIGKE